MDTPGQILNTPVDDKEDGDFEDYSSALVHDVDESVATLRPSRTRLGMRKRQRRLARRLLLDRHGLSNSGKRADKKVKWVRFDPFVTIKQPLKDDNSFRLVVS